MVLLAPEREPLARWCEAIEAFLAQRLKLALRPEMGVPFSVRKGIDFVGWKTWWNRRLPRRRTLGNLRVRLAGFERAAVRPVRAGAARRIDLVRQDGAGSVDRLRSVLASYSGHLRHGAAWRVWGEIWQRYPWLAALFARHGWALDARWSRRRQARGRRFQAQYWNLARRSGDDALVFFQMGRFIEFYGPQRTTAARALGLREVALPRACYAFTAGFPLHLFGRYRSRALRQGLTVVEVRQTPAALGRGCRPRQAWAVWLPGQ